MRTTTMLGWVALLVVACTAKDDPSDPGDDGAGDTIDLDADGDPAPTDCDDSDPAVHSGAEEHCDGADEDCDGAIDDQPVDGESTWTDADQDGFGGTELRVCPGVPLGPTVGGDCADEDPTRFPGAPELCNGLDDDCDALTAEAAQIGTSPFGTVDAAFAAAGDGDTITVCAGVHHTSALRVERALTVVSASTDPADTTLDAEGNGPVFLVDGGALTLVGLTLTGGTGSPTPSTIGERAGGAVNALTGAGGSVTARDCVFERNTAWAGGAVAGPEITLEDCIVRDNRATLYGGGVDHRGVDPRGPGHLTVTRTTFEGNGADSGGALSSTGDVLLTDSTFTTNTGLLGGALYLAADGRAEATFAGTTIDANHGTAGGGLYVFDTHVTMDAATVVSGNVADGTGGGGSFSGGSWTGGSVVGNSAGDAGGGIEFWSPFGADGSFTGITIDGNHAPTGGGLYINSYGGVGVVTGCVLTGNVADGTGGGLAAVSAEIVLDAVEIRGNEAAYGAGVYHDQYFTGLTIQGGAVAENVATEVGGGLYVVGGTVAVANTDFGEGATDNLPEDLALIVYGQQVATTFGGYGASAEFECVGEPALVCQ